MRYAFLRGAYTRWEEKLIQSWKPRAVGTAQILLLAREVKRVLERNSWEGEGGRARCLDGILKGFCIGCCVCRKWSIRLFPLPLDARGTLNSLLNIHPLNRTSLSGTRMFHLRWWTIRNNGGWRHFQRYDKNFLRRDFDLYPPSN